MGYEIEIRLRCPRVEVERFIQQDPMGTLERSVEITVGEVKTSGTVEAFAGAEGEARLLILVDSLLDNERCACDDGEDKLRQAALDYAEAVRRTDEAARAGALGMDGEPLRRAWEALRAAARGL